MRQGGQRRANLWQQETDLLGECIYEIVGVDSRLTAAAGPGTAGSGLPICLPVAT